MPYVASNVDADRDGTVVTIAASTTMDAHSNTALHVQVVAMVEAPSLAMVVVVRKSSSSSSSSTATTTTTRTKNDVPMMLQQLYTASETQILAALERGLDQLSAGNVKLPSTTSDDDTTTAWTKEQLERQTRAVLQDFLDADEMPPTSNTATTSNIQEKTTQNSKENDSVSSRIVDAEIVESSSSTASTTSSAPPQERTTEQRRTAAAAAAAALQTMQSSDASTTDNSSSSSSSSTDTEQPILKSTPGLDYAVYAAKLALAKQKKNKKASSGGGGVDYAVQQAARAANQKRKGTKKCTKQKKTTSQKKNTPETTKQRQPTATKQETTSASSSPPLDPYQQPLALLHDNSVDRTFRTSISTPEQFAQWKKRTKKQKQQQQQKSTTKAKVTKSVKTTTEKDTDSPKNTSNQPQSKPKLNEIQTTTNSDVDAGVAVSFERSKRGEATPAPDVAASSKGGAADTGTSLPSSAAQRKLNLRTTQAKLPDDDDPVQDVPNDPKVKAMEATQDDALNEMAESGQDMTPEELLADVMQFGEQQREEPGQGFVHEALSTAKELLQAQRSKREAAQRPQETDVTTLTPDEELRRMFAAGERLADGRITATTHQPQPASSITSPEDNKLIDSVIAADDDKTISSHARVLDDELVELELRINKSVGEEHDGPPQNPMFDIMSGPEVYDRNVDPETAVNWPGAMPGTKQVRHLPKELDEATKQANFAVQVLLQMQKTELANGEMEYTFGNKKLTEEQIQNFRRVVEDAVELGIVDDPVQLQAEESRLQLLLDELWDQPEERVRNIAENYKDLLLSDYFVHHVKKRLSQMAQRDLRAKKDERKTLQERHRRERVLLGHLVSYTQLLLKETQALGADLEAQQLEVIRSICKVAMNPNHKTEEETAMALTDAVRDMRPLFDDAFVAYLKYAVAEEEGRLARAGLLDDPEESRWLMVLQIVQKGVYAEIAKGINRYLEHIWYILRMETPPERRMFLEMLVDDMPTLDVRPFVRVVENIAGALGDSVRGEFDGAVPLGEMTNKLLQLYRDTKEVLPPERIAEKSRDADEWAAKQKQRLLDQRKLTKQRLKGAAKTEHLDEKIEAMERRGEFDRFD